MWIKFLVESYDTIHPAITTHDLAKTFRLQNGQMHCYVVLKDQGISELNEIPQVIGSHNSYEFCYSRAAPIFRRGESSL